MEKNEKRVSIGTIDKVLSNQPANIVTEQWFDIDVRIKKVINLKDTLEFVNDVVTSCFSADGSYMPEVLDFAIKSNILTKYANFSMPDNIDHRHNIIYQTDIVDFVLKHINQVQLHEIITAINHKLDYMCDANVSAINKQLTQLFDAFEKMQKKVGNVFNGVSPEDISNLVGAIGKNGIDEDKVVAAYLKRMGGNKKSKGK